MLPPCTCLLCPPPPPPSAACAFPLSNNSRGRLLERTPAPFRFGGKKEGERERGRTQTRLLHLFSRHDNMDTVPAEHYAYFKTNFTPKMSASSSGRRKNEGIKGSSRFPAELLSWKSWKLLSTFPSTAPRLPAASPTGWSEERCSKIPHFPQEQPCLPPGDCPGWGKWLWGQSTGGRSREAWRGDGMGFAQRSCRPSIPGRTGGIGLRGRCPCPWLGVEFNGF